MAPNFIVEYILSTALLRNQCHIGDSESEKPYVGCVKWQDLNSKARPNIPLPREGKTPSTTFFYLTTIPKYHGSTDSE